MKRSCPDCGSAVHVTKSIKISSKQRLQRVKCISCGCAGFVCVTESVDWSKSGQNEMTATHHASIDPSKL